MIQTPSESATSNSPSGFGNYFELLRLPISFSVDNQQLERHYQVVQMQVHPDKFAGASEQQQRMALQLASQVNAAYQTLRVPEKRAAYLLQLLSGNAALLDESRVSSRFLQEQMDLHDELLQLQFSHPDDSQQLRLDSFINRLQEKLAWLSEELEQLFASHLRLHEEREKCGQLADENFSKIANAIQQYRYISKLLSEASKRSNKN